MTDAPSQQGSYSKPQKPRPLMFTWRKLVIMLVCIGLAVAAAGPWGYCFYARHRLSTLLTEVRIPEAVAFAKEYGTSLKCPQLRLLSIRAYRLAGDLRAADELLTASEKLIDSPTQVSQERTLINVRSGRMSPNAGELPRMLRNPELDGRDVCEAYAIGFRLNRRYEEAAMLLEAWKADWPSDYRPFFHEGLMYQTVTDWSAAVTSYQKAVQLQPLANSCRVRLGECLNQLERSKEACEQFQIVTSRDEENMVAWLGLADGLKQQGDYASARTAYVKALGLDAASFSARISIAEIDFDDGNIESAKQIVDSLSKIWPEDMRTLYLQSKIYALQGKPKQSAELQERWKLADLAVQDLEKNIQRLAKSTDDIDLQVQVGVKMLNHYSRELGQQYIAAALQIAPGHAKARAAMTEFELKRNKLQAIPVPVENGQTVHDVIKTTP